MARTYYTLVVRHGGKGSPWEPQFGDYDRSVVEDERWTYDIVSEYARSDMKIIKSGDTQDAINAAIAKLNAKG